VGADRGRSFDRKLEDVLVTRLRGGQSAESLLADLRVKLGDEEADAVLSRAEARARPRPPADRVGQVLAGVAYGWTVILVLQNIGVLTAVWAALQTDPSIAPFVGFALLKIGLLCLGVIAYKRRRSAVTTAFYALTIVYAFPLGLFIDPRFGSLASMPPADPLMALSGSALLSYVAVGLITFVWWRGRKATTDVAEPSVFD